VDSAGARAQSRKGGKTRYAAPSATIVAITPPKPSS
jgi:hypothetical protein